MINKRSASRQDFSGNYFLRISTQELWLERAKAIYTTRQQPNLVMRNSLPGGTGFGGMKRSWRAAEAQGQEKPGEAIGGSAATVELETSGLKGSWREAKLGSV